MRGYWVSCRTQALLQLIEKISPLPSVSMKCEWLQDKMDKLTARVSDCRFRDKNCCVQCPVHRENFAVGEPFRQLPCNHFFHSEWIVPWLELRRCAVALDQQRTPRQPVRTTRTAWTTSSYFYRRDRRMLGEKRGGKLNYLVRSENESVSDR
ncbi:E3 ubiquitin-protein ligase RNF115-like isoform X2 [Micropterus salmoides]|uniref:E3 ubiquitin-protein ligase RNF115-like isoform X2 n=1 Tax=Micropterus salmoides TaxID=27706 RepID=UPI0018EA4F61|nr:E3 ubiquitin-protein ligase RNF115-like isoform X2 [Micropterus salmoides]